MAGNANSGRPKLYEEWNKISAINKLWAKINNKVMAGEELSEYEEKLVLALLPKTIKTETDITSDGKAISINIDKDIAEKNVIDSEPKNNSEG